MSPGCLFLATKNVLKIAPLTLVVLYFSFVSSVTNPFTDALAEVSQRERESKRHTMLVTRPVYIFHSWFHPLVFVIV